MPMSVAPLSLRLMPVMEPVNAQVLPMQFSIAMGVRKQDETLCAELNAALERNRSEIQSILTDYGVLLTPDVASR